MKKVSKGQASVNSELSYEVQANRAGADKSNKLLYDFVTILQTEYWFIKN